MAKVDYAHLEKNVKFKRYYLNRIAWWKNISLISPILLLFVGLAGILYYSSVDKLYSWVTLPYALVFLFGLIILRYVKSALQKKLLNDKGAFLCCASFLLQESEGYGYYVFSTENRFSESWIEKQAALIDWDSISTEQKKEARKHTVEIPIEDGKVILMKAISLGKIYKEYACKTTPQKISLLYINPKNVFLIKQKYLNTYSK